MANCPHCNSKLPFFNVAFLSRMRNKVQCQSCHKVLEAEKFLLGIVGALSGGSAALLIIWNKEVFGYASYAIIKALVLSFALIFIGAYFQSKFVKLSVVKNQNNETLAGETTTTAAKPTAPKNAKRIAQLKKSYQNKTDAELKAIADAKNRKMTPEAQEAAKQVLLDRNNIG